MEYLTCTSELKAIADAIRSQTGSTSLLYYPAGFISAIEQIPSEARLQYSVVTPTESIQTIYPGAGYDAFSEVLIQPISSDYVGTAIPRRSQNDLMSNGMTVTAPSGYYSSAISVYAKSGTIILNDTSSITFNSSYFTLNSDGTYVVGYDASVHFNYVVSEGWVSQPSYGKINLSFTQLYSLNTISSKTIIPTESSQVAVSAGIYLMGDLTIAAVSSNYVGSLVQRLEASAYTPGISNMYIPANNYLTGNQTILGDSNLVASNIKSGVSIFNINGTYTGEGDPTPSSLENNIVSQSCYAFPSFYENPRITEVGSFAFSGANILTGVSIPNCRRINYNAFNGCKIQSAIFPLCSFIDSQAFTFCYSLSYISFPLCEVIGSYAFSYAGIISADFPSVSIVWYSAFATCSKLQTVNLPICTSLYAYAFHGASLSSISIPLCTSIGNGAFSQARALEYISLPNVEQIGASAFNYCNLRAINLPKVRSLNTAVFRQCTLLSEVVAPLVEYVGANCFESCTTLTSINLPACVSISAAAFRYCSTLINVDLPICETLGGSAFERCSMLTYCSLSKVKSIGAYCFTTCSNLESFCFQECEYLSSYCFYNCSNLSYFELPNCSFVGSFAFFSCPSLSRVSSDMLPACQSISYGAFMRCVNLSCVELPNCKYIGSNCFSECSNLQQVSLPECISVIENAFARTNISSLFLPACLYIRSVNLSTLISVNLPIISSLASGVFNSCYSLTNVIIPNVEIVGSDAFRYCYNLSALSLPKCTAISSYAFYNCFTLVSLYLLGSSVPTIQSAISFIFYSTPIMGYTSYTEGITGSVYVPMSLLSSYKSAYGWSTISNRIVGIEEV